MLKRELINYLQPDFDSHAMCKLYFLLVSNSYFHCLSWYFQASEN